MIDNIHAGLRASALQHEAIASNIANINTPGYKARRVVFEDILRSASKGQIEGYVTNERHLQVGSGPRAKVSNPSTTSWDDFSFRLDGNSVDLDQEMAMMAENRVRYTALLQALSHQFQSMQTVLAERV